MSEPRTVTRIDDVKFGEALPVFDPDTSLANVKQFARAAGWYRPRFIDHEAARKEGLPGALVPGIMSQGFLAAMIHRWAPGAEVREVDTVFRAPVVVDESYHISGVVTDINVSTSEVEIDLTVTNDAGETRVFGTAKVRIP
jgi:acyl dehydratase